MTWPGPGAGSRPRWSWPRTSRRGSARAHGGRHSIVACARVGEQRLVKLRLDGAHGGVTLLLRWVPTGSDWRVAALEAAAASAAPPA